MNSFWVNTWLIMSIMVHKHLVAPACASGPAWICMLTIADPIRADSNPIEGLSRQSDCSCPRKTASYNTKSIDFEDLSNDELYFPMVAMNENDAFLGIPPPAKHPSTGEYSTSLVASFSAHAEPLSSSGVGKSSHVVQGWRTFSTNLSALL